MGSEPVNVTAAEAFVQCLLREGVDTAFGIASGYLSAFLDAARRGGLNVVTNLHEGAAGFAAAGYTLASGKLGVIYTQSGPGVTNAATPVASAYMDSIPQLLLATQAPSNLYGRDAHQEVSGGTYGVDQLAMFRPAVSAAFRPTNGETLVRSTRRAIATAHGRRTSTVLEVAADMWPQKVQHLDLAPEEYRSQSTPVDMQGVAEIVQLLKAAKAPAILVGNRYIHRGASADLVAFAEEQDIAVATVDYAKGAIPEDHPLCLGIIGSCGHESAAKYFQNADLVIALGTRMSTQTTFDFDTSLFPNLVHIDELAEEPGRNLKLRLGMVSDLPATVRALRAACGAPTKRGVKERVVALREEHHVYRVPKDRPSTSTPAVLAAIREVLPRNTRVTGDSGLTLQYLKHFFPVYAADGFYALYALAPMGSGIPLAIGVQAGRPDDTVLAVMGDGGTLVHLSELAVAAHYNLPVITVVCNNNGYKQVGDRMERYQSQSYGCKLPPVDFVAAARACGCDAYLAEDAESAAAAVKQAVERRKASVIEVRVKGDNIFDITPPRIKNWWDRMFQNTASSQDWPFPKR